MRLFVASAASGKSAEIVALFGADWLLPPMLSSPPLGHTESVLFRLLLRGRRAQPSGQPAVSLDISRRDHDLRNAHSASDCKVWGRRKQALFATSDRVGTTEGHDNKRQRRVTAKRPRKAGQARKEGAKSVAGNRSHLAARLLLFLGLLGQQLRVEVGQYAPCRGV